MPASGGARVRRIPVPAVFLRQAHPFYEVDVWLADHGGTPVSIQPQAAVGLRNVNFKLVQNSTYDYDATNNVCVQIESEELHQIDEGRVLPKLDRQGDDLLDGRTMAKREQRHPRALGRKLDAIGRGQVQCEGDGNLDLVVNAEDLAEWETFATTGGGLSSWYDLNLDGLTDATDKARSEENLGQRCRRGRMPR